MFHISVFDDNENDLKYTAKKLLQIMGPGRAEIDCFTTSEALLSEIDSSGYVPDIAVLDIRTERETDGIALAKQLNQKVPRCVIIFLSGYDDYVSDVYSTEHIFFINKLNADKYLSDALNKAVQCISAHYSAVPVFTFEINRTRYTVPGDDILYLERKDHKTIIATGGNEYVTAQLPSDLLEQNPSVYFINCHQSYWVNCSHIMKFSSGLITLRNNMQIPVSRSRSREARESYFAHIVNNAKFLKNREN